MSMTQQATAPQCIVQSCTRLSALSSTATGDFFRFTTFYCSDCYRRLQSGSSVSIDPTRIIIERNKTPGRLISQ